MRIYFGYIPDSKGRKEQIRRRTSTVAVRCLATEAREEIIEQLVSEGKTEEEIEMIIRCFGL